MPPDLHEQHPGAFLSSPRHLRDRKPGILDRAAFRLTAFHHAAIDPMRILRYLLAAPLLLLWLFCPHPLPGQNVQWQQVSTIEFDFYSGRLFGGPGQPLFLSTGFRSNDLGATWKPMSVMPRAMAAAADGSILIGTANGILRSVDDGETWTQFSPEIASDSIDDLTVISADVMIARSGDAFLRTTDGGENWQKTGKIFPELAFEYFSAVSRFGVANRDTLFCAASPPIPFPDFSHDSNGIYRSTDGGATWNLTGFSEGTMVADTDYLGILGFGVAPNGTILVGTQMLEGRGQVFRSGDYGASWSTTNLRDVCTSIARGPNGTWFATAVNSGVYRSTDDGRTWASISSGLADYRVFPLVLHSSGILVTIDVFGNVSRTIAPVIQMSSAPNGSDNAEGLHLALELREAGFTIVVSSDVDVASLPYITLVDMLGNETPVADPIATGERVWRADIDDVESGIYLVRASLGNATCTLPFIVMSGAESSFVRVGEP